jgi:hypothetical protein
MSSGMEKGWMDTRGQALHFNSVWLQVKEGQKTKGAGWGHQSQDCLCFA